MLSALLLDLDGTLTDSNELHTRAVVAAFEAEGYGVRPEAVRRQMGKGLSLMAPALLGPDLPDAHLKAIEQGHTNRYLDLVTREGVPLLPGAVELVRAAKKAGLKVALATSSAEEELQATAKAAGLDLGLFDVLTTATDVDAPKPTPEAIATACEELGVHPAETALVGDTPFDGLAARRAGSLLVGITSGYHDEADLRRAGARRVYATAEALTKDLDAALAAASPQPMALDADRLDGWMDAALAVARQNVDEGGAPIGALVVAPDGQIVARAGNRHHRTGNLADHAETVALALAGQLPQANTGYVLVTTLEPCRMCLGAALEARFDAVVWALEAPGNGGVERTMGPDRAAHGALPRSVPFVRRTEARALWTAYAEAHPGDAFTRLLLADTHGGPHAPYA